MSAAPPSFESIARDAQLVADSWTLTRPEATWTAEQAVARTELSDTAVVSALHKELWDRRSWYPSAREVGAICRAARAAFK